MRFILLLGACFAHKCRSIDSGLEINIGSAIINDDYCDCLDGSDEPLTSACYNNSYLCLQEGSVAIKIPSYKVDDGVCDCCDGSDEVGLKTKCKNTCEEQGEKLKKEREEKLKIFSEGLAENLKLKQLAVEITVKEEKDFEEKKNLLDACESEILEMQASLEQTRLLLKNARLNERKVEGLGDEVVKDKRIEKLEKSIESKVHLLSMWEHRAKTAKKELLMLKDIVDSLISKLENKNEIDLNAIEEEIESISESSDSTMDNWDSNTNANDEDDISNDDIPDEVESNDELECYSIFGYCIPYYLASFFISSTESPKILSPLLSKKEKDLTVHQEKQSSLSKEITELGQKINTNYGPENVWKSLAEACISVDDIEYTYEVCLFGKATQISKNDRAQVFLGRFSGFKDRKGQSSDKVMMYESGVKCWNGPARSVEVSWSCGTKLELKSVTEPERCEYAIKGISPTVCEESFIQHDEL